MTASIAGEASNQEEVFAFLASLTTDPPVHRIDTHAASVFLAGPRALKIKRAVRFAFLDYSTLAKRKAACEAELKVNHPFAPQIYHRVIPITRGEDGSLRIDGNGTAVEYAIEMTRFDERQTIDHLAESGPLEPDLVSLIADAVAASHARASPVPAGPWVSSIPPIIAGNSAAFRAAACFDGKAVEELDDASQSAFLRIRHLLEQRGEAGFVRHCHGDLHLGNIVLIEHKPVLFDAIEFDPVMASIDVLYDLAFPVMDLLHTQHPVAANILFNRYLTITSDENMSALAAFALFMSMRAAIRAKVLYDRHVRNGGERAALVDAARAYFERAHQLIHPPAPKMVAVGGLSGTGKSVLARALAAVIEPQPGAVVLRSDVTRKRRFQISETDRLPTRAYRPEVTQQVYDDLAQRAGHILSKGHSVIVDAVFARGPERSKIRDVARQLNVPFIGLFLAADLATRVARVGQRKGDASDATPEIARFQEGYDIGAVDWACVDASGTPEQTLENGKAELVNSERSSPG